MRVHGEDHATFERLQPGDLLATLKERMFRSASMRLTTDWLVAFTIVALAATGTARAQESNIPDPPAASLVRIAVANEVAAAGHPNPLHMFRSRKQTPRGTQTRLYVETDDALAAVLIAVNDQPLAAQQQQAESGHLQWLMDNPDQLRKKRTREKEDEERTMRILKALPDAFHYEYDGTEMGTAGTGEDGARLVKLKFSPNPEYSPPSRVEQVLEGMQGELLIDSRIRRIAAIEGTLFREVSFGWGIIGHLDKGGHFLVRQGDLGLGDGEWGITEMKLDITGKVLMFKGLKMVSDEVLSDFRVVGKNLTFAQGVELLKTEQEKLARNSHAGQAPDAGKTEAEQTSPHR
jgi:hypothetical protein